MNLDPDTDYELNDGAVWVQAGNISVHIKRGDDGVSVTLYAAGREDRESLAETWATYGEAEADEDDNE